MRCRHGHINMKSRLLSLVYHLTPAIFSVMDFNWRETPHAQSYSFTGAADIQWLVNEGKPRTKGWLKPLLLCITAQHLPLPNLALFAPFPTLLIPRAALNNISACKFSFHNLLLENPIFESTFIQNLVIYFWIKANFSLSLKKNRSFKCF